MNTSTVYIRGVPLYICIPYLLLFFFSSFLPVFLHSLYHYTANVSLSLSLSCSPSSASPAARGPPWGHVPLWILWSRGTQGKVSGTESKILLSDLLQEVGRLESFISLLFICQLSICQSLLPSFPLFSLPLALLIAYWRAEQTSWPICLNYIQLPCSMGLLTFAIAVVSVCYSTLYRYSAEKRYYPYGKDEEGIAQSIREGLLNPNRSSSKPGRGSKQVSHMISNPWSRDSRVILTVPGHLTVM